MTDANHAATNGGQPYLSWNLDPQDFEKHETDLLQLLGAAVLDLWLDLPQEVQKSLFRTTTSRAVVDSTDLKNKLARFLHDNAESEHSNAQ